MSGYNKGIAYMLLGMGFTACASNVCTERACSGYLVLSIDAADAASGEIRIVYDGVDVVCEPGSGTTQAPGLAEVERAQRDGRWVRAYARSSSVPADLADAFTRSSSTRSTAPTATQSFTAYRRRRPRRLGPSASSASSGCACARHETVHPQRPAKVRAGAAKRPVPRTEE